MKKTINNPSIHVVRLCAEDIIATSMNVNNTPQNNLQGNVPQRQSIWE